METENDPIGKQFKSIQNSKKQDVIKKRKVEFDIKNYLNVKLSSKETEKKVIIRVLRLTQDLDTDEPLIKPVYVHYLPSTKKTYICTKQTENLPEGTDKNCPFCDIKDEAKEAQKGASTEEWNKLKEVYKQNGTNLNYIVRVVDRNDEDFGIKFWKFTEPVYKMIKTIYDDNMADDINIFDYENGKDIVVTIEKTKEGKSKITSVTAKNKITPLASTTERINELSSDDKVWNDVYGIKTYDYLEICINGGEPFFDKVSGKWVEKQETKVAKDTTEEDNEDSYHEITSDEMENNSDMGETDDLPF